VAENAWGVAAKWGEVSRRKPSCFRGKKAVENGKGAKKKKAGKKGTKKRVGAGKLIWATKRGSWTREVERLPRLGAFEAKWNRLRGGGAGKGGLDWQRWREVRERRSFKKKLQEKEEKRAEKATQGRRKGVGEKNEGNKRFPPTEGLCRDAFEKENKKVPNGG